MPRVHLLVGPVGAGKSTFARRIRATHGAILLDLDEWMAVLFRPDRPDTGVLPWYSERTARSIEQIWQVAKGLVEGGNDVVLEIGLIRRNERERFYTRLDTEGIAYTVYVLDAPRDVRRERVEQRNLDKDGTFKMVVPEDIFELASDLWEPPDERECRGRRFEFIARTDGPI